MPGTITTCYSFKGGSGRSMSLANVAWSLAARGKSVLAIDWDLEAPGLHRYFHPFLEDPQLERTEGLVDGLWQYVNLIPEGAGKQPEKYADFSNYVQALPTPFEHGGSISLLSAGRQDNEYTTKVGGFDWHLFYTHMNGRKFVESFGEWARQNYDHVLIDSRTGVSDTAGICTVQLPDILALFFVYNRQSIEGTAAAGRAVLEQRKKHINILACPSRVEDRRQADPARWYAALCLEGVLKQTPRSISEKLRIDEIPHFPWCGYEEKLAVFEESADQSGTLLQSMEALAERIGGEGKSPETFPRERLDLLWRRAAFRDPRLDELEALREGGLLQRIPQIKLWLAETIEEEGQNRSWATALSQEAISLIIGATPTDFSQELEAIGEAVVALGQKILHRDQNIDTFIEIMRARAVQLRRLSRFHEAYNISSDAIAALPERITSSLSILRLYELRAEIAKLLFGPKEAVEHYRALLQMIENGQFSKAASSASLQARAQRALAEALLDAGEPREARKQADIAVRLATRATNLAILPVLNRDVNRARLRSPEPALARVIQARAALSAFDPDAEGLVDKAIEWAHRIEMPSTMRIELEVQLRTALARHKLDRGDIEGANTALDKLSGTMPPWAIAEIASVRARMSVPSPQESKLGKNLGPKDAERVVSYVHAAIREAGNDPTARELVLRRIVTEIVENSRDSESLLFELLSSESDQEVRMMLVRSISEMIGESARRSPSS